MEFNCHREGEGGKGLTFGFMCAWGHSRLRVEQSVEKENGRRLLSCRTVGGDYLV